MTQNTLKWQENKERVRSNKAQEGLKGREVGIKAIDTITKIFNPLSLLSTKNDPSWYNLDKRLVKDSASISYGRALGSEIPKQGPIQGAGYKNNSVAGIMRLNFTPSIGNIDKNDASAAINIASRNIYAFVRHENSGHANYDAPDLMMYLLHMDSCYTYVTHLMRMYAIVRKAKAENRYYDKAYGLALGLTEAGYEDLISNLAGFRTYINMCVQKLNAFYVPNSLTLFRRHIWMAGSIFKDSNVKKSQEYVMVPGHVLKYDEANGKLLLTATNFASLSAIKTQLNGLISVVQGSEDLNIMSGDILKAYKDKGVFFLSEIEPDFNIESCYNEEVLSQINNATITGDLTSTPDNGNVIQDPTTGVLYQELVVNYLTEYTEIDLDSLILNMYKDDVTEDETMVASRLMVDMQISANSEAWITKSGTEFISKVIIYHITPGATSPIVIHTYTSQVTMWTAANLMSWGQSVQIYTTFNSAPRRRVFITDATNRRPLFDSLQFCNYAVVEIDTLSAMHDVALLSEYAVPITGTNQTVRNSTRNS